MEGNSNARLFDLMNKLRSGNLAHMHRKDCEKRRKTNKPSKNIISEFIRINKTFKVTNTWDDVIEHFTSNDSDSPVINEEYDEYSNNLPKEKYDIDIESYYGQLLPLWNKYIAHNASQFEPTTKMFTIRTSAEMENKYIPYKWESTGANGKVYLSFFTASVNELERIFNIKVIYDIVNKRYYYTETKEETEKILLESSHSNHSASSKRN